MLVAGFILAVASLQAIAALECMQGLQVIGSDGKPELSNTLKQPELSECGPRSAVESTALLFTLKPNSTAFAVTDKYKCYDLKVLDKGITTVVRGCIYRTQEVCDGKFSSQSIKEVSCAECHHDGCNTSGGLRSGPNFALLGGFSLVVVIGYLMKQ